MITPGLNRPRPNITADLTWGSPLSVLSGCYVSTKAGATVGSHYPMGPGLSMFRWCEKILPLSEKSNDQEEGESPNLLSRVVHELVVRTTEYLPVTREGGVRDDEVATRIAISIPYFRVMNTNAVSRRRLGLHTSTVHPKAAE